MNTIEERLTCLVRQALLQSAAATVLEEGPLERDALLIEKYGLDSVGIVNLVVAIEREFEIELGEEDLRIDNFRSVSQIADLLAQRAPGLAGGRDASQA
jgi:acyl carrier protein